ncbi:aa3-type cytochrome c oxidase subunit IV [Falsigemmobacter faecalis]|uniref:Aa3-type cytochrome c oxidase subunit IV n=1 Tax=Falsigemmobacter faecalis TaxID=2488730 RepID=A0A3P3DXG4_9RHOB|nr:aa3-type cytochrome c oxidase subunit IV [Falsigemmobacter faecalis]RRH78456.1 aa3-type cytochrome c oxidase subunit IV [Falsigemmobacter faecalis]
MAEHKHGSMDTTVHQATFNGFIKFATWVGIISAVVLIFLALANA